MNSSSIIPPSFPAGLALFQDGDGTNILKTGAIVVLGIFLLVFLFVLLKYANLYLRSVLTKAGIGIFDMFAMSLRKVDPCSDPGRSPAARPTSGKWRHSHERAAPPGPVRGARSIS